jgi:WD40 repeat protein
MIQARRMSRLRFADLAKIGTVENPVTATIVAIDRLGREAALSWDHDLYFFELPGWSRALQSRVSTFSLIQAMVFVGEGNRLVLGLDNGYLWVVNPSTGGLLWLHATQAGSLTALAAHPTRPWILAGSTDRTVRLWNLGTQEEVAVFQGHSGDVAALAFSPQGDRAISADDQGKVILWDLEQGRMLAQRVLTGDSITRLVWTDEAVVGGTMQGNLVLSSEALEMTLLPAFESAVTALAVKSPGYLVAGSQDGRVCVWATLRP